MSLQAQLDAYKAGFIPQVPQDALAIMQRAGEELANSGILDRVLIKIINLARLGREQ